MKDHERLVIFLAAELARRRRSRGLKLSYPEAYAIIADEICEGARDGASVADLMASGRQILTENDVLPGVSALLETVMVEAVFEDGQKLVCVHDPIQRAGLEVEPAEPGQVVHASEDVEVNGDREEVEISVTNRGDRPVQVGSHFHFFEVNAALDFDRERSYGRRLAIPAGTATRFEPGEDVLVRLVPFGGARRLSSPAGFGSGHMDDPQVKARAMDAARKAGYLQDRIES